jgi:hypothetical protein
VTPDVICFTAAMDAVRGAAEAEGPPGGVYRERMQSWRALETMHAYNSEMAVMAGRAEPGAAEATRRLLAEMKENDIPRNVDSFNMALAASERAGDSVGCERVMALMGAERDLFTFLTAANAFVAAGRHDRAVAVLLEMAEGGSTSKSRWPAYYARLWPRTLRALHASVLRLADRGYAKALAPVLAFLPQSVPMFDMAALARDLTNRNLCVDQLREVMVAAPRRVVLLDDYVGQEGGGAAEEEEEEEEEEEGQLS